MMARTLRTWISAIIGLAMVAWSLASLQIDLTHLSSGARAASFMLQMFPRRAADFRYDLSLRTQLWQPFLDTIQMAVAGTALGALAALPLSFLAARTSSLPRVLTGTIKTYLNISRAVPTIVYALLAVSAVGLGKAAGAMAIGFVSFISLSKLYAEALESVSQGPVDAVRAVGGNSVQVFVFGMLPQVFPGYVSTTLYTFEYSLNESFIVGIVGAGGLGAQLRQDIDFYKWLDAGVIVALLILLINLVDYGSYRLRAVLS
jgi:phosphonate transport system permease protein